MPPPRRQSSPELGNLAVGLQYNKNGRPIRRRKRRADHDFVDSSILQLGEDDITEAPSDDEDTEAPRKGRKRQKRSPSPTPPPLNPVIYNEDPDEPSDNERMGGWSACKLPKAAIELTFNIPLGFHGPLVVKMDKDILNALQKTCCDVGPLPQRASSTAMTRAKTKKPHGFKVLPAELRNKIYEMLFVADGTLSFHNPHNFCRSAQFLRTCKLVWREGCSVLYGQNKFVFHRNRNQRSPFWEPNPKEIGYQDFRLFLKTIGPDNLACIRDVTIHLEDAGQAATPYLSSQEARRYVNDGHLIDCLRILRSAELRKLTLYFSGRRSLARTDVKFLSHLERVKADEVDIPFRFHSYSHQKIHLDVEKELVELMKRKKKLYPELH
ncbi:uncharacterized protein EI97DRAFT_435615 [Westerdykella ornata]|uniref:F-box domain-containing protein n=1 Tax=Westerdykella ornata TaxID=318751 RepID=A0A6A6JCH4_WESOR|nr:uncharacterized protein EI97DRAFT_435615 [Westerdykella ornata]KAF2273967.1 hypothetical protein EI97DRAFT_435615 [Westerdykella ornata]